MNPEDSTQGKHTHSLYSYMTFIHLLPADNQNIEDVVHRGGGGHIIDHIDSNVSLVLVGRHQQTLVDCLHVVVQDLPAQIILH